MPSNRRAAAFVAAAGGAIVVAAVAMALATHASTASLAPEYRPGRQTLYRLAYRDEGVSDPTAALDRRTSAERRTRTNLDAILTLTTVEADDTGADLLANLVEARVEYHSGEAFDALHAGLLEDDARRPFALRLDRLGRIVRFAPDPATSEGGAAFERGLASTLEVVLPNRGSLFAATWQSDEPTRDGERRSTYALAPWLESPFGARTFSFHRTSALVTAGSHSDDGGSIVRGTSLDEGSLDADGSLARLHAFEVRTVFVGSHIVARSQALVNVESIGSADVAAERLAAAADYGRARLAAPTATGLLVRIDRDEVRRRAFVASLRGGNAQSLEAALASLERSADPARQTALTTQFGALFALEPATIGPVAPRLGGLRAGSVRFEVYVQALAEAGTAAAQTALADLALARRNEPAAASEIAIGLGLQPRPTAQTEAALRDLADRAAPETRDTAELALGSVARNEADAAPARARAAVRRAARRLAHAPSDDARRIELLALGNAVSPSALDAIAPFANDRNATLRAAAVTALRRLSDSRSDALLTDRLTDPDAGVRAAAAAAFDSRAPGDAAFAALRARATSDADANVRISALEALWATRTARPEARSDVSSVAANDADRRVREAASRVLSEDPPDDATLVRAPQAELDP